MGMESSEDEWDDVLDLELYDDEEEEELVDSELVDSELMRGAMRLKSRSLNGSRRSRNRLSVVDSLTELCFKSYLKRFSVSSLEYFLLHVPRETRVRLSCRLLAASLVSRRARPLLLRLLVRLWPNNLLTLTDLAALSPRWRSLLSNLVLHGRVVVRALLSRLLQTLLDTKGCNMRLTTLDMANGVAMESAASFASTLVRVLLTNRVLLRMINDAAAAGGGGGGVAAGAPLVIAPVRIRCGREVRFWLKFLHFCPKVIRIVRLELVSPLTTGSDHVSFVLKHVAPDMLTKLRVDEERLHNVGGQYEPDVDHLVDVNVNLYGQEWPHWQRRLVKFTNITSLALVYPIRADESRRLSPSSVRNWSRILARLRHLTSLNLHGNLISNQLATLMGDMATSELRCLDVEYCGLVQKDLDFMANSGLGHNLRDLNIGDLHLGRHPQALLNLLNNLRNVETLSLCMEQYYLFSERTDLSEKTAPHLMHLLVTRFKGSLRFLNLGGHAWSPECLLNVVKAVANLDKLYNLILPVDGLSQLARARYEEHARVSKVALDVDVYGPELALLKEAVATLVANANHTKNNNKDNKSKKTVNKAKKLRSRALKHGVQFLLM